MDGEILETTWSVTLQSLDNLYPMRTSFRNPIKV